MGNLHGRRVVVAVHSNHLYAIALKFDHYFFA
jgi:hypothetical protein